MVKISYQGKSENIAKVVGRFLPVSRKVTREIAKFIKDKPVDLAIAELDRVILCKMAVPYKRYNRDIPHRRGIMAGRYPKTASLAVIRLLKSLKTNAEDLGLNTSNLVIVHAASQHGPLAFHYGRHRGRHRKLSHFEIVAAEGEAKEEQKKEDAKPKVKKAKKEEKK